MDTRTQRIEEKQTKTVFKSKRLGFLVKLKLSIATLLEFDIFMINVMGYLLKGSVPLLTDRRYCRRNSSSKLGCNLRKLNSKISCREKTDHCGQRKSTVPLDE